MDKIIKNGKVPKTKPVKSGKLLKNKPAKSGKIIPIEVKSGNNVRSVSLNMYINEYKPEYAIRFSTRNFGFENNIKSIPLYAVFCIK